MQDSKLLASVVLFRELYDEDKDIYDVIGALLKAAMTFEKKWAFNVTEAAQLLETTFGFNVPEAVVGTTLRNRLKNKENLLTLENGVYSLITDNLDNSLQLSSNLKKTQESQSRIFQGLVSYVVEHSPTPIEESEHEAIIHDFSSYLLDDDMSDKYSGLISSYIIEKQNQPGFKDNLNAVREGFVLYNGMRYTSDLNDLGTWKTDLIIYLDTEHLFNAGGYNGELFKQLFDDFFELVRDINSSGKKYIELKYFQESKEEIENFFYVAELIFERKITLDPSKSAMLFILEGSNSKSNILEKKALLYSELERKKIYLEDKEDFYDEPQYVIEGPSIIEDLKDQATKNRRPFDEDKCNHLLKLFTKINVLRKGENSKSLEKIGHILMSGKSYTHYLAFNPLIKKEDRDIPLATDVDFLTNRFWFKLRKGLGNHKFLPRSLDVVAKAQVVLSSQINHSVSEKYDALKKELSEGKITRVDAEYINHELRSKTTTPEEITPENIESKLAFLSHDDFETHIREKSKLELRAEEGDIAKQRLADIERDKDQIKMRNLLFWAKFERTASWIAFNAFLLFIFSLVIYLVNLYRSDSDSSLTVATLVITCVFGFLSLVKFKKIKQFINARIRGQE